MQYKALISRSARFIVFLGCSCFIIFLIFLVASYSSAVTLLEKQFEKGTFPRMNEMIDQSIGLFFTPPVKGLSLLSDSLDWRTIMTDAAANPRQLKDRMKAWAAELDVNSIGISDRDRRIVWDYWSDKPIVLNPGLSRDKWFFDLWDREKIPDWTFTLYREHDEADYQLYIDRLIRDRQGRPVGSIAAKMQLVRLKEQLMHIIGRNERVIILDDTAHDIIDISRMETGKEVKTYTLENFSVKNGAASHGDPLIAAIMAQVNDYGSLKHDGKKLFYKRTSQLNGAMSILAVMDGDAQIQMEKAGLRNSLIILFSSFSLFIGGILFSIMFYTRKFHHLALDIEVEKARFEDLLFIVTHGFGNEIHLLKQHIETMPRRFAAGISVRLSEMNLMIQNSVNAARIDSSKALIITKPYLFSWQWEKLTDRFEKLAKAKGQTFTSSPAVDCVIHNDEEMVYQILANLVSNAVKYAPKNGSVDLNARLEGHTLVITVKDSGPGFLSEDGPAMFSKFKKLSAKPTGGERSTGLGLYIVKQLTDACSIRITFSNGEGELCGAFWKLGIKASQSGI